MLFTFVTAPSAGKATILRLTCVVTFYLYCDYSSRIVCALFVCLHVFALMRLEHSESGARMGSSQNKNEIPARKLWSRIHLEFASFRSRIP